MRWKNLETNLDVNGERRNEKKSHLLSASHFTHLKPFNFHYNHSAIFNQASAIYQALH